LRAHEPDQQATINQALNVFKAARLFSPQKANSMQPTAIDIECSSAFPFFGDDFIMKLNSELLTLFIEVC